MKRITFIILAILFEGHCYSQEKKDTIFGFVGTWKNKITFVIDSNLYTGAKGGTITITPKKQIVVSTPSTTSYNKQIDEEIKQAEKSAEEIPAYFAKEEGISQATLAKHIKEQLVKFVNEIKTLKIENVKEEGGATQNSSASCTAIEAKYNELLAFYTAHKKDETYDIPPPPEADYFNCWFCDPQKQIHYDILATDYAKLFAKTERDLASDASEIMKSLQIDFYTGAQNPKKPTCNINTQELTAIWYFLNGRMGRMAKQLLKDSRKNYKIIIPVAKVLFSLQKNIDNPNTDNLNNAAGIYAKLADTLFRQLKKEKDYTLLRAIPFMISLNQEAQVLNGTDDGMNFRGKLQLVGRFKLTTEMDIKMGKDGGYIIAHLKGESNMIYEVDPDDCLHIVPAWKRSSNASNWNSISMKVINLEMISPKGTPPKYIGTQKYTSAFPKLKLNFCKQGTDSIYFQTFNPDPVMDGTWLIVVPNTPPTHAPAGLMGVDRMFMDIDDLQSEAQQLKAPPAMDEAALKEIQKISNDIQKNGVTADKMKRIQELTQKSVQLAQEFSLPLSNFKFVVNMKNKNPVLFDHRFDAKQINPALANDIVYGYFKIKLEVLP